MTAWKYVLTKPALRYLKRQPLKERSRIFAALDTLITHPENADIKRLKGMPGLRLRVGKYRVIIQLDEQESSFVVTGIGPRGDIYKS